MAHVRAPGFGRSEVLAGLQRGGYVKKPRKRRSVRRKALVSTAAERRKIAREAAVEAAALLRQGGRQQRQIGRTTTSAVRAVQSTPTFGLDAGRYARQVQQEIKGQTGDIIGFGRAQKKLAGKATRQDIAGVQAAALAQARDLVFKRRQELLGTQRERGQERRQAGREQQREVVTALHSAIRAMHDPDFLWKVEGLPPAQRWAELQQAISGEGVSPKVGRQVTRAIREQFERGVPGVKKAGLPQAARFLLDRARASARTPYGRPGSPYAGPPTPPVLGR